VISFADAPLIVTMRDGTQAADESSILCFGVEGERALILAARELMWVDLSYIYVETSLAAYEPIHSSEPES